MQSHKQFYKLEKSNNRTHLRNFYSNFKEILKKQAIDVSNERKLNARKKYVNT